MPMDPQSNHTFRGRTMSEAVARLKAQLGPDAVIVQTRRGGDAQGPFVEITARPPESASPTSVVGRSGAAAGYRKAASVMQGQTPGQRTSEAPVSGGTGGGGSGVAPSAPPGALSEALARKLALLRGETPPEPSAVASAARMAASQAAGAQAQAQHNAHERAANDRVAALMETFAAQLEALENRLGERNSPAGRLAEMLEEAGVSEAHARVLAERACQRRPGQTPEDGELLAALGREMADSLPCSGDLMPPPGGRRVLAFVGPTGVGKTTTIAKIAARAGLMEGRSVALITLDTFRMAAVEQLAAYARILDCPLRIARNPEELRASLDAFAEHELVLIDTTGRSPRAAGQAASVRTDFPEGWGGELVLTLSATTRERDLFAAVDAWSAVGVDRICLTKLDETDAPGALYSATRRAGRPLTWVTTGQRVPEDIEVACPATLAARIVARATRLATWGGGRPPAASEAEGLAVGVAR